MKKLLVVFVLIILVASNCFAAKSAGNIFTITQPDGTILRLQLLGDEHFSWYQTPDGVLLKRDGMAYYIASTQSDGTLLSTGVVAHNAEARDAYETEAIRSQNKNLFFFSSSKKLSALAKRKSIVGYPSAKFCPHTGTVKVPIILMNYTDTVFTFNDKAIWREYFNETTRTVYSDATKFNGYSSVATYFYDASQGNLNFQFDVYGPYTSDHGHDYYGHDQGDSKELELLKEAVTKSDADVDFSNYDSNGDGIVDMVYVVYAGTGANLSNDEKDFWPACWYSGPYATVDGKNINIIGGANELAVSAYKNNGTALRAGIGVTCHEMSHGMGMPDLYWTSSDTPKDTQGYVDYNNCGPEDWDVMDGGENLYNAMWPCQYAGWEREIMGWVTAEELTTAATVTLFPLNKTDGKICKITNPANPYEYYIIENALSDEWNAYSNMTYGSGLMITHVNTSEEGLSMAPNNTYGKPSVTILPADGFILADYSAGEEIQYKGSVVTMPEKDEKDASGAYTFNWQTKYFIPDAKEDPYVGSASSTQVTSLAAYKNYTGDEMVTNYPITDITRNADGSISFKFMGGTTWIKNLTPALSQGKGTLYNLQGQRVGAGYRGIVIKNGRKFLNK